MRPLLLTLLALPLFHPAPADAGTLGGGTGGGGALGRVSSGLGRATASSSPSTSSGSADRNHDAAEDRHRCFDDEARPIRCPYEVRDAGGVDALGVLGGSAPGAAATTTAKVDVYAGAQKVLDSNGAVSLAVAVTDWRLRLSGGFSHYFETLPGGGRLTMTMPTLMGGLRIDDLGATRVYVEGGVVHVGTDGDPMADSSITGPIAGMTVEHSLSRQLSIIGDVHAMWFPHAIRARAGRVGVRYGHFQASLRVLDFNVGPALLGPEVGVRF